MTLSVSVFCSEKTPTTSAAFPTTLWTMDYALWPLASVSKHISCSERWSWDLWLHQRDASLQEAQSPQS